MNWHTIALTLIGLSLPSERSVAAASGDDESPLELKQAEIRGEGRTLMAEIGRLRVPQFHEEPDRGSLELAVLVRRSKATDPGPPIFFLNGIPSAATSLAGEEYWDEYLELGDVVLIDQRGSGRSSPQLTWSRPPFRAELFLSNREAALENMLATAKAIRLFTQVAGVDLAAFNTRESARDIDRVREALGYEQIRVVGYSGGSHLGFEVVRLMGDRVESFVSLGTAGPNDIHSLPSQIDASLRKVSALAAADERIGQSMPDLYARVEAALDRLDEKPLSFELTHPESGESVTLELGRFGLQFLLLMELGDPEDMALLPRLIHELEEGRSDVLSWYLQRRYAQLSELPVLLFVNRAASGATAERWKRIRREAPKSPFGLARCFFSPELDEAFGIEDLGDDFRSAVKSDVRALFVSASLDGKTPPARAEMARKGFPNSTHLVLENGGHNDLTRHPEGHHRVVAFLAGDEMEDERIELPAMRFALLEGEDPLVSHPALD